MRELFSTVLNGAIPWVIPCILFCSFVYNWRGTPTASDKPKEKKSSKADTKSIAGEDNETTRTGEESSSKES